MWYVPQGEVGSNTMRVAYGEGRYGIHFEDLKAKMENGLLFLLLVTLVHPADHTSVGEGTVIIRERVHGNPIADHEAQDVEEKLRRYAFPRLIASRTTTLSTTLSKNCIVRQYLLRHTLTTTQHL